MIWIEWFQASLHFFANNQSVAIIVDHIDIFDFTQNCATCRTLDRQTSYYFKAEKYQIYNFWLPLRINFRNASMLLMLLMRSLFSFEPIHWINWLIIKIGSSFGWFMLSKLLQHMKNSKKNKQNFSYWLNFIVKQSFVMINIVNKRR